MGMRLHCFCGAAQNAEGGESARKQAMQADHDEQKQPPQAVRAAFMRIIRGLTRSEEEEYVTASEGEGSPPKADTGHLTARSSSASGTALSRPHSRNQSRRPSSAGGGGAGGSELEGPAAGAGAGASPAAAQPADGGARRWGGVLGGVPFLPGIPTLLSALSPQETEEEEAEEEEEAAARVAAPTAATATAAVGGSSHEQQQQQGGVGGPPNLQRRSRTYPGAAGEPGGGGGGEEAQPDELAAAEGDTTLPAPLQPGNHPLPELSEPSSLMSEEHIRSLVGALPTRHRSARWRLQYSTLRDGISMQTLLRSCRGKAPTVIVVRDMGKHVFGAFCSEPWRMSQRYYGTGETFVFQLEPRQVAWFWWWQKMAHQRNDFFMWGAQDAIAVGGAGGYALWLDSDLGRGLSRSSLTFGNDSLSSEEEFRIGAVELWWLS